MGKVKKTGIAFLFGIFFGGASIFSLFFFEKETDSYPSSFPIHQREAYTVAHDTRFKIPFWTKQRLTTKSLEKNVTRDHFDFFVDDELSPLHRSTPKDYQGSGFDRGHLAPAADATFNELALKETFKLSNICPQNPNLNRGFWARLEKHIRTLTSNYDHVDVVTGPLFLPVEEEGIKWVKFQVIGKNDVAVPTHFFKFVSAVKEDGTTDKWGFVIPNSSISKDASFDSFLVPIDNLEKISGLSF